MDTLFVTAIEGIYDAALDPPRWPNALQAAADCLGDVGASLIWHRDDGTFGSIVSPPLVDAQRDYEQKWMANDLRTLRAAERSYFFSGTPFTDRHLCSDEEIRTHPSYTEFQAQHGLGWLAAVTVSPNPHVGVVLCIHRNAKTCPPFSGDELSTVAQLGRHVEKSLRLSIHLFDAELMKAGLGEALARVGIGVFALDSLGRVVFSNPAGTRLLGDGLAVMNDRLLVGSASAHATLETAIERMTRGGRADILADSKPILIQRQNTERPLSVYMLPLTLSPHPAAEFLSHARAIVLVIDPEATGPADPALVRDALGLTLGEARVAALIGSGLGPRETAGKLGITEATARSVLKQIFSKTGVSRQSELVLMLSKLLIR